MEEILALLNTAKEALQVAKKNLDGIKDDDLKNLVGISEELGRVREEYQKVESDIRKKQRKYFDVLVTCEQSLGLLEIGRYYMSDGSLCQIYHNGVESGIFWKGVKYKADELESKIYVELVEAVIARIFKLAKSLPIELVAKKIRLVEELKKKIQQLIEDERLKILAT